MEDTLLAVAEQLFLEKGFDGTSTTEIARRAGCNQTLVHYYFRTKQNLFTTIFEKKFLYLYQGFMSFNTDKNMGFEDKLKYYIETHSDLITKDCRLPLLIAKEIERFPQLVETIKQRIQSKPTEMFIAFQQQLKQEIADGKIRPIELLDLIITIISLNISFAFIMPALQTIFPMDEDQKKELIAYRKAENVDFILKSLRP